MHAQHGPVGRSPVRGEARPVDIRSVCVQLLQPRGDAVEPVEDGAEDVEEEDVDVGEERCVSVGHCGVQLRVADRAAHDACDRSLPRSLLSQRRPCTAIDCRKRCRRGVEEEPWAGHGGGS